MNRSSLAWLAVVLLPALAQAATYKFTSFQYPGADGTVFTGIDDTNRVVGYANYNSTSTQQGIFITAAGSLATINPPGDVYGTPSAINHKGGVVGTAFDGTNYSMFQDNANGFGTITDLLINQGVSGINASFNIVGNFTSPSLENAVYAEINGVYKTLLPDRCQYTHDPAINDDNVVVGNCVSQSNTSLVFTWSKGKYTYYTPPSNMLYVQATGINKAGVIVGWYNDSNGLDHGFMLDAGVFTTVDNPSGPNTQIWGINKAGKLVGDYFTEYNTPTAFSATPQ
jgi:hypothetical protein